MSKDGFMDKIGDAAAKVFGTDEQRYKDGTYKEGEPQRRAEPYPMGDTVEPGATSHYGAQSAGEMRISGSDGDRGRYDDDPHYKETRASHLGEFDRDYDEYRREHGSADRDFGTWRTMRQGQRGALSQIREHMEVVGKDGEHVGTVDKVRGDEIVLTKSDAAAGGVHHSIPVSWIQGVGEKVMLNRHGDDARKAWSEEGSVGTQPTTRALGEREDQGSDGPHILDRSFAGTYDKDRS